jgi:DNA polymerase (family 10)
MRDSPVVGRVEVAGSARRGKETVGDLDVLVSSLEPEAVSGHFIAMLPVARVLAHGLTKSTIVLKNKLQVDLRVIPPKSYGAALQYFTGSKEHNVILRSIGVKSGFKLNEYGLFDRETDELLAAEEEEEIYEFLGMDWIPPELRENTGEIEAAIAGTLPNLVEGEDIKGDLHIHSNWSDGRASLEEMIQKAVSLGHSYIAVTDHTKTLAVANGLDEKRLRDQVNEVKKLDEKYPELKVLTGTECNILGDGSLDIKDDVLRDLDWVVASIHSGFRQDEETITKRIIDAIHNEYVNTIGHPTGRLIQRRSGYSFYLDEVLEAAAEQDVMMEINCYPDRLDFSDVKSRRAKEHGVMVSLGSDAHIPSEMEFLPLGLSVARRGWLEAKNVANTFSFEEFLKISK